MTAAGRNNGGNPPLSRPGDGANTLDDSVLDFARASGDWFWEIDAKGRFTFISDQISEMTRLSPDDCIGKTREEMQSGRSFQDSTWAEYDNLLKTRKPFRDFRFIHVGPDGVGVPIAISGVPVFKGRRFMGYRGTGRRVPQGEVFERLIRNIVTTTSMGVGHDFLNLVAVALCRELAVDQVYICRVSDDQRTAESVVAVAGGRRLDNFSYELAGTPCREVVQGSAIRVHREGVAAAFPEDQFLEDHGIEGYIGLPLRDAHGKILGLMSVLSQRPLVLDDLHRLVLEFFAGRVAAELDRALSEEMLRNSQILLASIIDNLPQGLTVKDVDKRYLLVNRAFTDRYGRPANEVLGRTSSEAFPQWGPALDESLHQENQVLEDSQPSMREQKRLFADGSEHHMEITKFPIRDAKGALLAIGTLNTDATERYARQVEAAERENLLRSHQRALDAIVASPAMSSSDPAEAFRLLTRVAAETLGVERVSVWRARRDHDDIECLDLFHRTGARHSAGTILARDDFPAYFDALKSAEVIDAADAANDPRTREFAEAYFRPLGITALLDAAIYLGEELRGVLCVEDTAGVRPWTLEEQSLARSLANLAALIMARQDSLEAERVRRSVEQRFVEVVNALPSSLSIKDKDMRYVFVNKVYEQNYGVAAASVMGRTIRELNLNDEGILASIEVEDTAVLREGRAITRETTRIRGDGSTCAALVSKFPLFDATGNVEMVATLWTDITNQKAVQRSLEEAQAGLRAITDNVPIMLCQKDLEGRFKGANQRFADWHGVSLADLIGKTSYDLLPAERAAQVAVLDSKVIATGEVLVDEAVSVLHRQGDGGRIMFRMVKFPVKDTEGNITGVGTAMTDVTAEWNAREALAETRARLAAIIENLPIMLSLKDRNGVYQHANTRFAQWHRIPLDRLMGLNSYDVLPEDRAAAVAALDTKVLETGEVMVSELESILGHEIGGRPAVLRQIKFPVTNAEGQTIGVGTAMFDITEQRRAEEALQDHLEKLEEAVAGRTAELTQEIRERERVEAELRRSESNLRQILEKSPVGIAVVAREPRRRMFVNDSFLEMLGAASQEELDAVPMEQTYVDTNDLERLSDLFNTTGIIEGEEVRRRRLDGSERWLLINSRMVEFEGETAALVWHYDITARKMAEEALARQSENLERMVAERTRELGESESLLNSVFENLPVGLIIKDDAFRITSVNATHLRWYGARPEQALGRKAWEYLKYDDADDLAKVQFQEADVLARGTTTSRQVERIFADGKPHTLQITKFPIFDRSGAVTRVGSVSVDVTEQVEVRHALQEREAWLTAFTNNIPMFLNLKDLEGHYRFMNERYRQWFGFDGDDVLGKTVFDLLPPDRAHMLADLDARVLSSGKAQETEAQNAETPDGDLRTFQYLKFPVRDLAGAITGIGTAVLDVTDRRRADLALKESEARFRGLFEHAPAGITISTIDGRYLAMTKTFLDWKGWNLLDVVGQRPADLFGAEPGQRDEAEDARVVATKAVFNKEITIHCADGRKLVATALKAPMLAPDGEVTGVCTFYVDVSDIREIEAQLQQAQKMEAIGRLAGGIAHDFNNLLGAIMGFNEFLIEDLPVQSPQHNFARRIARAGERAKQLISQILAFSRAAHGEQSVIDLNAVTEEAAALMSGTMPVSTQVVFTPSTCCDVKALSNAGQMTQVLMNLGVNANDSFAGNSGEIRIAVDCAFAGSADLNILTGARAGAVQDFWEVKPDGVGGWQLIAGAVDPAQDYVRISVADNGPGIAEDVLRRVFDPFFTTKGPGKGTGLGLAVVHGIVAAHHGAIRVNTRLGAGTRFEIYLPAAGPDAKTDEAHEAPAPITGSGLILVVDDERDVADMVAIGLERMGFEVGICADAKEALEILSEDPGLWRAVISDQVMPDMRGMDLIKAVKELYPDLPCILCTGYGDTLTEDLALAEGADAFFQKPVSPNRLGRALVDLLPH